MKNKSILIVLVSLFIFTVLITNFVVFFCAAPAQAQKPIPKLQPTIAIASLTAGTLSHTSGMAILKLIGDHTNLKVSLIPTAGETEGLELLKSGEAQLAVFTLPSVGRAFKGLFPFKKKYEITRLVFTVSYVEQMFITGDDTDIYTRREIKGRKVTAGYVASPGMQLNLIAQLANAGLTLDDIRPVIISNYPESVRAVIGHQADVCLSTVDPIPVMREFEARRGVRILPLIDDPEAIKRMEEAYPGMVARYARREDPTFSWIKHKLPEKFLQMSYKYGVYTSSELSDDIVYKIIKAVWENVEETHDMLPDFKRDFRVENMFLRTTVLPYHTGAIKWYKEKGVWPRDFEMEMKTK